MRKRFFKPIMVAVVFLLITGICFAAGPKNEARGKKELVIISGYSAANLDPVAVNSGARQLHGAGAIEYLVRISPKGRVEPELAESFRNVNPNTWVVRLRPNVTFWSGKLVDARAVKASLERSRKLAPQAEKTLSGVRIEEIDALTLRFITETPIPFLFYNIATTPYLAIHNADSYGDKANPLDLKAMDTTGPFRMVDFAPDQLMVLERWNGYWGRKPKISRIIYKRITDPQALLIEALSGRTHIVRLVPPEGAGPIENSRDMKLIKAKIPDVISLYLNTRSPQLEDVRVRRALGWGIDRQEVIALGYNGQGKPAPSWYSSNVAYPEARKMGFTKYDPKRAGQLLDEAGWMMDANGVRRKNGQVLKLRLVTYGIQKAAAEVLQSQLIKIGIVVDIQYSKDWGFVVAMRKDGGQWDATLEWWDSVGLTSLWRHFATEGDLNYSHYDDQIMNQLIEKIGTSFDEDQQHKLILQANKRIFETASLIPVLGPYYLMAVNKNVKGYVPPSINPAEYIITPEVDIKK